MIKKLIIVGNGFDLAHKLPTSYMDFKEYLEKEYLLDGEEVYGVPSTIDMPYGEQGFDVFEVARFIYYLLIETYCFDWSNFEVGLGLIDYSLLFDTESLDVLDDEGDVLPFHSQTNYEVFSENLYNLMMNLKDLFSEWIESINLSNIKIVEKANIIDEKSDVISFNYTATIENLYTFRKLLHIHGISGKNPIFGHGLPDQQEHDFYVESLTYKGAQNGIINAFRKPVEEIIENTLSDFLDNPIDYEDIYFWGFSFSNVDIIYIKYIISICKNLKRIWLENHDETKNKKYKNELFILGFKGEIKEF